MIYDLRKRFVYHSTKSILAKQKVALRALLENAAVITFASEGEEVKRR